MGPLSKSKKLISLDVVELNPTYDQDQATARLAARCVEYVLRKNFGWGNARVYLIQNKKMDFRIMLRRSILLIENLKIFSKSSGGAT
jgi:hypothetical protein